MHKIVVDTRKHGDVSVVLQGGQRTIIYKNRSPQPHGIEVPFAGDSVYPPPPDKIHIPEYF